MMPPSGFPAKLLLFGEYSILLGSAALSIPFPRFGASLELPGSQPGVQEKNDSESNLQLQSFYRYLTENRSVFREILDLGLFGTELSRGLYLMSSIPPRYGLGSSGALCAAVYDRYRTDMKETTRSADIHRTDLLRRNFIAMESYFHGRSSGFDPLVSFLNIPMLLDANGKAAPAGPEMDMPPRNGLELLLVDTLQEGKTGPPVNRFIDRFAPGGAITPEGSAFTRHTHAAISAWLDGEPDAIESAIRRVSVFQFENLLHLVPVNFHSAWSEGIESGMFSLKLCGSGNGGFILCFTRHKIPTLNYFNDLAMTVIADPLQLEDKTQLI